MVDAAVLQGNKSSFIKVTPAARGISLVVIKLI